MIYLAVSTLVVVMLMLVLMVLMLVMLMLVELNVSSNMCLGARRSGSAMKPEINATCRFIQKTPSVLQCRVVLNDSCHVVNG